MFEKLGRLVVRRARTVLVIALLAMVAFGALGAGAFGKLKTGGFIDGKADSTLASQAITAGFGGQTDLVLLVRARSGTVDSTTSAGAGSGLTERLSADDRVSGVVSYWSTEAPSLRSTDGREALVLAHIDGDEEESGLAAPDVIDAYARDSAAVTVRAGGGQAVGDDIGTQVGKDLAIAESIAVPLTLLLLIVAFGSVVAALLPLAVGLIAILGTFAELFVLGSTTDVSIFSINLTTALGLGLAIDYALLMVNRFREELAAGAAVEDAVVHTVRTAGRTIVFSAATVAAALAALLVFPLYFLRSFAYAGVGVIVVAMLGALIVLPALFTVLGHRVNAGRLPWLRNRPAVAGGETPFWRRLAGGVMRRPVLSAVPVVAVLLVAASPLLGVVFGTPDDRVLPTTASSRQVGDALRTDFTTNDAGAIDVVTTSAVAPAALAGYARTLSELPSVARVDTSAGTFVRTRPQPVAPGDPRLGTAGAQLLSVIGTADAKSAAAERLVHRVRATAPPAGTRIHVGGTSAELVDSKHSIGSRLPIAALLIALTTFVILWLFTGSVIQPLRALTLNVLSLSATLGVMVWIFQEGHLSSVLGFTPLPTDTSMPVLLFCVAFGLSMDYEVFLLSRIKELHDHGADTTEAVTHGLARTGRIVSTAAVLLAISFFAFVTSQVSFIQLFGLGTGLAILIDATLVRGVLVPAFMAVVGERSWWSPAPLRRLHARVGLEEAPVLAVPAPRHDISVADASASAGAHALDGSRR